MTSDTVASSQSAACGDSRASCRFKGAAGVVEEVVEEVVKALWNKARERKMGLYDTGFLTTLPRLVVILEGMLEVR